MTTRDPARSNRVRKRPKQARSRAMFNDILEAAACIIERDGLKQETDTGAIEALIAQIIADNAAQVEQYRASDENKQAKLFGFFVGQAMKASRGKANPAVLNELLKRKLHEA